MSRHQVRQPCEILWEEGASLLRQEPDSSVNIVLVPSDTRTRLIFDSENVRFN